MYLIDVPMTCGAGVVWVVYTCVFRTNLAAKNTVSLKVPFDLAVSLTDSVGIPEPRYRIVDSLNNSKACIEYKTRFPELTKMVGML